MSETTPQPPVQRVFRSFGPSSPARQKVHRPISLGHIGHDPVTSFCRYRHRRVSALSPGCHHPRARALSLTDPPPCCIMIWYLSPPSWCPSWRGSCRPGRAPCPAQDRSAAMVELADTRDLTSLESDLVPVRPRLAAPRRNGLRSIQKARSSTGLFSSCSVIPPLSQKIPLAPAARSPVPFGV